jgi:hypothetical protein
LPLGVDGQEIVAELFAHHLKAQPGLPLVVVQLNVGATDVGDGDQHVDPLVKQIHAAGGLRADLHHLRRGHQAGGEKEERGQQDLPFHGPNAKAATSENKTNSRFEREIQGGHDKLGRCSRSASPFLARARRRACR